MKLLFIHDRFGAFAGAEANLIACASELKRRGHEVGILHGAKTGKGEAVWNDVFLIQFPLAKNHNASLTARAIDEFEPDLIYLHKENELELLDTLVQSEVPVVSMVHDHDLYCMRSYRYHYFSRRICARAFSPFCVFGCGASVARNHEGGLPVRWVSYTAKKRELELHRQFDRHIVATDFMKAELVRNGFDPQKIEIHAPVPCPGGTEKRGRGCGQNLIIYAGQIIRGKGVDILLEALAKVRVPFECHIYGEGNHREHCERMSRKLLLEDRVSFKGYVPKGELERAYQRATLMVMSSVWPEPFGAVGIEGMRHALPVVAFDAGGVREWLFDGVNGYLVPWMDRDKFAARVEELLQNKTLAKDMGEQGLRMTQARFDFTRYISGLEKLFRDILCDGEKEVAR